MGLYRSLNAIPITGHLHCKIGFFPNFHWELTELNFTQVFGRYLDELVKIMSTAFDRLKIPNRVLTERKKRVIAALRVLRQKFQAGEPCDYRLLTE